MSFSVLVHMFSKHPKHRLVISIDGDLLYVVAILFQRVTKLG